MILSTRLLLLFLLSTVCLALAWQSDATAFFIFFAFVPVFFLLNDRKLAEHDKPLLWILTFLSVLLTAWFGVFWIRNVDPTTHFVIALLRGLTMMLPYIAAYLFLFSRPISTPIIVFIAAWMIMEVLHDLNILGMSYGNLGHVLAAYPGIIQWYSITGNLGGTLWILLVNFALFLLLRPWLTVTLRSKDKHAHAGSLGADQSADTVQERNEGPETVVGAGAGQHQHTPQLRRMNRTSLFALAAALPLIVSLIMFRSPANTTKTSINVIALHTSMDVYDYKYEVNPDELLNAYIASSKEYLDTTTTNIIFWPENAVMGDLFPDSLNGSQVVQRIRKELVTGPEVMVVTGAIIDRITAAPDPGSYQPNILYDPQHDYHFKRYNTALFITRDGTPQIKMKKRLVPMSEQVPAQRIFAPLVSLVPNLEDMNFSPAEEGYPFFDFGTENSSATTKNLTPPNNPVTLNTGTTPNDRTNPAKRTTPANRATSSTRNASNIRTSPIICYGSAFSTFTANEVLQTKSNFLVILLNEGWMKSEKAYRHFNWFAICRAIENRRFVVKSSNEGITTLINSKGTTSKQLSGTTSGAVTGNLEINETLAFYTKYHRHIAYGILIAGFLVITGRLLKTKFRRK